MSSWVSGTFSAIDPCFFDTLWKTLVFALFIAAFGVLEHVVTALIHHRPVASEFEFSGPEGYELLARVQLQVVGLVPLVAFMESDGSWVRASFARYSSEARRRQPSIRSDWPD